MKTVLITGCSSGFGRDLVPEFLSRKWKVYATMRNAESRKELFAPERAQYGDQIEILGLDVTHASDRARVRERLAGEGKLDCLVNNAGYGLLGPVELLSEEEMRAQMETNFFAPFLMMREFLPLLRAAKGRIINVSSVLGFFGMPYMGAYCASKFALEGLTESLAYELRSQGVQVCLVEPGSTKTGFDKNTFWSKESEGENPVYAESIKKYRDTRDSRVDSFTVPPQGVVRTILRASEMKRVPLRLRSGKEPVSIHYLQKFLPERAQYAIASATFRKMGV